MKELALALSLILALTFLCACTANAKNPNETIDTVQNMKNSEIETEPSDISLNQSQLQEDVQNVIAENPKSLDEPYEQFRTDLYISKILVSDGDGVNSNVTSITYDDKGRILSYMPQIGYGYKNEYTDDGEIMYSYLNGEYETKTVFKYGEDSYTYSAALWYNKSDELIPEQSYECDFDDNGRIISSHYYTEEQGKFRTEEYVYDESGNMIRQTSYDPDGAKRFEYIWEYDEDGRLIVDSYQNYDANINLFSRHEFTSQDDGIYIESIYNENNELTSRITSYPNTTVTEYFDENGKVTDKEENEYYESADSDILRNLKKSLSYSDSLLILSVEYNSDGRISKSEVYQDGSLSTYYIMEYQGNSYTASYYDGNNTLKSTDVYTALDDGRCIEFFTYDADGNVMNGVAYAYNTENCLAKATYYGENNEIARVIEYKYIRIPGVYHETNTME